MLTYAKWRLYKMRKVFSTQWLTKTEFIVKNLCALFTIYEIYIRRCCENFELILVPDYQSLMSSFKKFLQIRSYLRNYCTNRSNLNFSDSILNKTNNSNKTHVFLNKRFKFNPSRSSFNYNVLDVVISKFTTDF